MTFQDIFTSGFLDNITSVSILDMAVALALAFGLGFFIFLVYRRTFSGVMYSSGFGLTLIALTMISTLVILAVTSNVVLSLGMVGALSIVRFRTAIKEPMDIAFLFWSIASGIVLAAGMLLLAVAGSLVIGLVILVLAGKKSGDRPYLVIIRCASADAENRARALLEANVGRAVIKSKSAQKGEVEVNFEVRIHEDRTGFITELADLDGVQSAILVSYNGDYLS